MKVSIVIPVYNASKYLERSLSCALSQTYKDIEILLVENGSTDNSLDICKEFSDQDRRISVFVADGNVGAGIARNIGIENATGDYICFLDADDWYEDTLVEKMVNAVSNNNADVGICAYEAYVEDGSKVDHHTCNDNYLNNQESVRTYFLNAFPDGHVGFLWNKIYKASVIKENHLTFPPLSRLEDGFFNISFFELASSCVIISDELYHYRLGTADDVIAKHDANYADLVVTLTDEALDAFKRWNIDASTDETYKFCLNELGTCIENVFVGGWGLSIFEKIAYLNQFKYVDTYEDAIEHLDLIGQYRRIIHKLLCSNNYLFLGILIYIKTFVKRYLSKIYYLIKR